MCHREMKTMSSGRWEDRLSCQDVREIEEETRARARVAMRELHAQGLTREQVYEHTLVFSARMEAWFVHIMLQVVDEVWPPALDDVY
jgi:hypothetical protein